MLVIHVHQMYDLNENELIPILSHDLMHISCRILCNFNQIENEKSSISTKSSMLRKFRHFNRESIISLNFKRETNSRALMRNGYREKTNKPQYFNFATFWRMTSFNFQLFINEYMRIGDIFGLLRPIGIIVKSCFIMFIESK